MNLSTVLLYLKSQSAAGETAVSMLRHGLALRMEQSGEGRYRLELERAWTQPSEIELKTVRSACELLGWRVVGQSSGVEQVGMLRRRWVELDA